MSRRGERLRTSTRLLRNRKVELPSTVDLQRIVGGRGSVLYEVGTQQLTQSLEQLWRARPQAEVVVAHPDRVPSRPDQAVHFALSGAAGHPDVADAFPLGDLRHEPLTAAMARLDPHQQPAGAEHASQIGDVALYRARGRLRTPWRARAVITQGCAAVELAPDDGADLVQPGAWHRSRRRTAPPGRRPSTLATVGRGRGT